MNINQDWVPDSQALFTLLHGSCDLRELIESSYIFDRRNCIPVLRQMGMVKVRNRGA